MGSIPAILVLPTLAEANLKKSTLPKFTASRAYTQPLRKLSAPSPLFSNFKIKKLKPKVKKTYASLRYNYTPKVGPGSVSRSRHLQPHLPYQTTRSTPRKSFVFFQFTLSPTVLKLTSLTAENSPSQILWQFIKPYRQITPDTVALGLESVTHNTLQKLKLSTVRTRPVSRSLPVAIPYKNFKNENFSTSKHSSLTVSVQKPLTHYSLLVQECVKRLFVYSYTYSHTSAKSLSLWTKFDNYLAWSSNRQHLGALNILSKNKYKKYFSHYTYIPSTGSKFDDIPRYKIPDLSFSARGSLVRNSNKLSNLLPTDYFTNQLTDELSFSSQFTLTRERYSIDVLKTQPTINKTSLNCFRSVQTSNNSSSNILKKTRYYRTSLQLFRFVSPSLRPNKSRSLGKRLRRVRFLGRKRGWRLRKKLRFVRRLRYRITKIRRLSFRRIKIKRKIWRRSRRFIRSTLTSAKRVFQSTRPRSQYSGLGVDGLESNNQLPLRILKFFNFVESIYQPSVKNFLKLPCTPQLTSIPSAQSKPSALRGSLPRAPYTSLTVASQFFCRPILLRYFTALQLSKPQLAKSSGLLQNQLCSYRFGPDSPTTTHSNLWSVPYTRLILRKHLLQRIVSGVFSTDYIIWYCKTLVHFLEDVTGRRVNLNFGPFIETALTFGDKSRLVIWRHRVAGFQRMLGHKIFVQEALILIIASIRLKDPTFLANWIRGMLKRMSFWKYRLIFRYIKFVLQHLLRFNFEDFQFKGFKLRLKGKISVAGNARTRTLVYRVGNTSHSKMSNKVAYDLSFVNTFTGVMGFKLWFFY